MSKIPSALIEGEVYINGINSMVGVGSVELPSIEYTTVTSELLGVGGEIEVAIQGHLKKLEAKIKMDSVDETLLNFDLSKPVLVEVKGAYQYLDRETHGAGVGGIDATFKGNVKKIDGGTLQAGSKIESSFDIGCTYYALTINGRKIIEIDVLNNKHLVNGVSNQSILKILGKL